ncbi:diguanylate cyclase, partial [Thalassolituus sp. UBA1505]
RRTDEIAARFGGEEFALIMEAEDATALNRIRQRMDEAIHSLHIRHDYSPASKELTVSYGIAWIRDSGPWLEEYEMKVWLRAADAALYEAKAAGRNCNMLQILSRDVPLTESPVLQQLPG